jgi:hypothetical protein
MILATCLKFLKSNQFVLFNFRASKQALGEHYEKIITYSLTSKWNLYIETLDLMFVFEKKNVKSLEIISPRKTKSQKSVELYQFNSKFQSIFIFFN